MNFKSLMVAAGALATMAALTSACASSADDPTTDDDQAAEEIRKSKPDYFACKKDSDCVAVPRVGCCHNGWNEAVNKHKVSQYEHSFVCNKQIMCPMYMVDDTRVAECNTGTQKCEMVAIDDIACGGFTINPHTCPTGYDCVNHKPFIADIPGTCEAHVDADAGPAPDAAPDATTCVQHVMCTRFSHFDSTLCKCVANPTCGGFAGLACPSEYTQCVDDPNDSCDPAHGGADCGGICVP